MDLNIKKAIYSLNFFNTLSDKEVDRLIDISSIKYYSNDFLLHYEKSKSDKLLFLVEGLAKAYKVDKHDNEIFLYFIHKNHILSEISSLQENYLITYSNILFIDKSQVLSIDYSSFKKEFLNNGRLCLELASEIIKESTRLKELVNREFIFNSVAKVAMMLYSNLNMFNRLKRYDVSLILHIQPSTLSRVLNRLKQDSIITIERGEVIIVNREKLADIFEGI